MARFEAEIGDGLSGETIIVQASTEKEAREHLAERPEMIRNTHWTVQSITKL